MRDMGSFRARQRWCKFRAKAEAEVIKEWTATTEAKEDGVG
jgi:hypothetical protein